jgi:hypothetical protein
MAPTVTLPNKDENQAGARLIPGAVLEAVAFLEIARPVEVKWAAGLRRAGSHRSRNGGHVITLSTYRPADQLSETLWHELVHAVQAERYPTDKEFSSVYVRESRTVGYQANRFEVEAREIAADFSPQLPLSR